MHLTTAIIIAKKKTQVTPPAYQIALFQTFATNMLLEAAQFFTIRSILNVDVISETGSVTFTSQAQGIQFTSVTDMTFVQSGLTNAIIMNPARYFNVSTTFVNMAVQVLLLLISIHCT